MKDSPASCHGRKQGCFAEKRVEKTCPECVVTRIMQELARIYNEEEQFIKRKGEVNQ